jgi:RNA polymerase sigma factor (sigma-70 family)
MAKAALSEVLRQARSLGEAPGQGEASDAQLLERFVRQREEAPFASLLRRHGPMVWSVCERVLHRVQDAEDVFQATFLLLARKAAAIRKSASVGSWLHGVALRLAIRARMQGARRQARERQARDMRTTWPGSEWTEAQAVLDEALAALPEKYRTVVVLCCLEDRSHAEVAQLLRCPLATVRTRLARGRTLLRNLLTRRGVTLSAAALATLLGANASTAPAALTRATLKAAVLVATGAAAPCSARVAGLVEGGLRAMALSKFKTATAVLLAASLVAGASAWLHCGLRADEGPSVHVPADAPATVKERYKDRSVTVAARSEAPVKGDETIQVRGQVLDPDGKPLAGAKLYLKYDYGRDENLPVRATSDAEGHFAFAFPRSLFDPSIPDRSWYQVMAIADGYGPDWAYQVKPVPSTDLKLRLVRDLPIRGRIVTLDGRPVRGATLQVEQINTYVNLEAFLQTVRDREWPLVDGKGWSGPFPGQPRVLTTDAEGRFRLTGLGRDRLVEFRLEGPGIQYGPVRALAREMKPVEPRQMKPPAYGPNMAKVYGATFDHAAVPSRPIRGVVRDKKTGLPVAGVEVDAVGTTQKSRSDKDGRYELLGCAKSAEGYFVYVNPAGKLYFSASVQLPDTPGLDPVAGDIELIVGLRVEGRVTHRVTGKPMARVQVHYNPLYPNPFVRWFGPNGAGSVPCSVAETGPDGSYRLVVLPGPGVLGYIARSPRETFMPALVTTQDLKDFFKDNDYHGNEDMLRIQGSVNGWTAMGQAGYHHLLLIKPGEKDETLTRDVTLQPARAVGGNVVGPEGKRLVGVRVYNPAPGILSQPLADDTFTVQGLNPRRTRHLVFVDKDRRHGAFVTLTGEPKEPLTVRLEACGAATGRLLDPDGEPVAETVVRLECREVPDSAPPRVKTDRQGRFRMDGLVPGQKYQARLGLPPFGQYLFKPFTVKPGESKHLGDVQVKAQP